MYCWLVEKLGVRIVFKTFEEAERYVETALGDDEYVSIYPCLMFGGSDD